MGEELQKIIDKENLQKSRNHLKQYKDEIQIKINNKTIDKLHLDFLCDNPDLDFEEINLVKSVFDFIKSKNIL